MKGPGAQFWAGRVTSDRFDVRLGQLFCFSGAVLTLALGFWKLARLDLTEAQLYFGVLLTLNVPLLCTVVGLLLPIANSRREPKV